MKKELTTLIIIVTLFVLNTLVVLNAVAKTTTQEGIDLIKKYEGFSSEVYLCPALKATIGYGHLVKEGESFKKISKAEGERILKEDVRFAEEAVSRLVKVDLTQGQFNALVSFVYNLGEGNFATSTLLKELNRGNYNKASKELERWVYVGKKRLKGLERRRNAEIKLFAGS